MRTRFLFLAVAALGVAAVSGLRAGDPGHDRFPHATHSRLFPTCTGCHAGAAGDGKAELFPSKEACASCHDGGELRKVDWSAPHTRPTNLRFSHADHAENLVGTGKSADCATCHTADGGTAAAAGGVRAMMRGVKGPQPQACLACHKAPTHLAESARCRTCHVTLAKATALDTGRIAALPKPDDHQAADFGTRHGAGLQAATAQGRCAMCHARESCERCHMNGASIPAIAALQPDSRVAMLTVGRTGSYPLPRSHGSGWDVSHAGAARTSAASCGNCHAQAGCKSCHIGDGARAQIGQLPTPEVGEAQGVLVPGPTEPAVLAKSAPGGTTGKKLVFSPPRKISAHAPGFADAHGAAAASGSVSCSACHEKSYCSTCHAGSSKPVFHPANFMTRHGSDAYSGAKDCGSCHNTQSFCKSCHQGLGYASQGRVDVAFHTGQPMWLLQHGEAARKGLEGCTSCHRQQDCTRCHSATGGWGVNPHGSGFNVTSMSERNQLMCARCHITTPGKTP